MLRPWTETFIEVAGENAGCLIHRVKPWNGNSPQLSDHQVNVAAPPRVPPPGAQGRHIRRENFISQKTHISDEDYVNHVMVNPVNDLMVFGEVDVDGATTGNVSGGGAASGECGIQSCPQPERDMQEMSLFGLAENRDCQSRFGVKSMRLNFNLGYPLAKNQDTAVPFREAQKIADDLLKWYGRPHERAEITVRGDVYHIGHYIPDYHTLGITKWWYIEGCTQEWIYGEHWYSTIHLSESRTTHHNPGWGAEFCAGGGNEPGQERGTFTRVNRL